MLTYERGAGAEQCPNEPSLRRSVAAHLGYDPFVAEATLHVVARITSSRRGLVGTVEAREDGELVGEREIPSPTRDCVELARALALAISVAVDPFSLTRGQQPEPQEEPAPPVDPLVPPAAEPEPPAVEEVVLERVADAPPADVHRGPRLGAGAGLGIGSVPRARPFVSLHGGYGGRGFAVRLDVRLDTPARADGPVGGEARALAFATRAYGCARIAFFEPCGVLGMQVLFAKGTGVDDPRDARHVSPLVGLAAFVRVPTRGRLGVSIGLGLDVPLSRPRLRVQLEPAWTMPPVLGTFGVAFDYRP